MDLSLAELEAALAPIEDVGHGEITFDVGGTEVTLRVLYPEQEIEVQKFASLPTAILGDGDEDTPEETSSVALEYIERFKVGLMAHALVQIGDKDLREVEYVWTGKTLPNGKAVKIPKVQAMRKLLKTWTGPLITRMFRKYHEALAAVERKADKAIEFSPSDLGAEIERLERRIQMLKEEKDRVTQSLQGGMTERIQAMAEAADEEHEQRQDAYADAAVRLSQDEEEGQTEAVPDHIPPPIPQGTRQSIIPQQAAPPVQAPVQSRPEPVQAPQPQAPAPQPEAVDEGFIDASDHESAEAEVARANAQLMAQRQEARQPVGPGESVLTAAHEQMRRPPHMDAAEAAAATAAPPPIEQPEELVVDGKVPAFRMPTQELSKDLQQNPSDPGFNQGPAGAANPRFAGNRGKPGD